MKRIFFGALILLGAGCLTLSANAAATFFYFTCSPSAWVGNNKTTNITTVSAYRNGNVVRFAAGGYELDMVGQNSTVPQIGFYPNATRWPFNGTGVGMSFTSPGRGDNTLTGWFNVLQADYDGTGVPTAFAVDWVQYDEGNTNAWNRGSIRFNSDIAAPGPVPSTTFTRLFPTNGIFQFTVSGPPTTNCVVQVSSDLVTWTPLRTNAISPVGLLTVSDIGATDPTRFYRVVYSTGGGGGGGGGNGSNDQFANRIQIPSAGGTVTGSNTTATIESGEPNHGNAPGGKSVWWTWTAPASGIVSISTDGSSFDTTLGVYTGTAVGSLTSIAQDDEGGAGSCSRVEFNATAGVTYQIAVDGYYGATGNITLRVKPGLLNDNFADRLQLVGPYDYVVGCNIGATYENSEPYHWGTTGFESVWWQWQAPLSGSVTISTFGSSFDTIMAAYTGSSLQSLSLVANNDDFGGYSTSQITFNATAGTVYQIAVDGYDVSQGFVTLILQQ